MTSCMLDSPLILGVSDFELGEKGLGGSFWHCMGVGMQARSLAGNFELWSGIWSTSFSFVLSPCQFCQPVIVSSKFTFTRELSFGARWSASSWYSAVFVSLWKWTWPPQPAVSQLVATPVSLALPSTALASAVTKQNQLWQFESDGDSFAEKNWHLLVSQSPLGSLPGLADHILWSTSFPWFMWTLEALSASTRQSGAWRQSKYVASLPPCLTACWFRSVGSWSVVEPGADKRQFIFWKPVPLSCLCDGHHGPEATLEHGSFQLATTWQKSLHAKKVEHEMLNFVGFSGSHLLTPSPPRSDGEGGLVNRSGIRPTSTHAEHFLLESMCVGWLFVAPSVHPGIHADTLGGPRPCEKSWSHGVGGVALEPESKLMIWQDPGDPPGKRQLKRQKQGGVPLGMAKSCKRNHSWTFPSMFLLLQLVLLEFTCTGQGTWMQMRLSSGGFCLPEGSMAVGPQQLLTSFGFHLGSQDLCVCPQMSCNFEGFRDLSGEWAFAGESPLQRLPAWMRTLFSGSNSHGDLCVCPLMSCNAEDFSSLSGVQALAGASLPDELAKRESKLLAVTSCWPASRWYRPPWVGVFLDVGHVQEQWSWSFSQDVDVSPVLAQNLTWMSEYPLTWPLENISTSLMLVFKPLYLSGFVMVESGTCTWVRLALVFPLPLPLRLPLLPTSSRSTVQSSAFVSSGFAERWEFFGVWKTPKVLSCLSGLPSRSWLDL